MAIEPVVFTLSEPIKFGKETYTELTFPRELKTKDLVKMDSVKGQMNQTLAMYASMSDTPIPVFGELSPDDFGDLALAVAPLMGKRGKAAAAEAAAAMKAETEAASAT